MNIRAAFASRVTQALFVYGALFHFIALRIYVFVAYKPPADRSVVDNLSVNISLAILGGLFTAILLFWLRFPRSNLDLRARLLRILGGAFCAMLSTVIAVEFVLVGLAMRLAWQMYSPVPGLSLFAAFELAMIDIETYGLIVVLQWAPYSFVGGAIVSGLADADWRTANIAP